MDGESGRTDPQVGDRQDVELMYEFYTDLRDEVNQSIEFQNQIVIGGGVLIGVAYGLQFSGILEQLTMENPTLRLIIAALPTITLFTIALWIVEQSRMMRAGYYLHFLENKINAELDGVYLTWENWLRDGNTSVYQRAHYVGQMIGYALFLYGLAALGLVLYAVEFLGVSPGSVRTLSVEGNALALAYFLLTLGLFLYLTRYTYLIIFHEIDEEASFERFKDWEADYADDVVSGFAYQHEIDRVRDAPGDETDDGAR